MLMASGGWEFGWAQQGWLLCSTVSEASAGKISGLGGSSQPTPGVGRTHSRIWLAAGLAVGCELRQALHVPAPHALGSLTGSMAASGWLNFLPGGPGHQVAEWKLHHFLGPKPGKSHSVTSLPRFKGNELYLLMAWSRGRRACGTGVIVTAMSGKYSLSWGVGAP